MSKVDRDHPWKIFLIFLRLGLTSFGGPIAHLGYFREELVVRRKWLSEQAFADLVALCQFLPGPASSQVGIGLGLIRGGVPGAFASWTGFTMPSAVGLILFAYGISTYSEVISPGVLHGLKVVAVAVVALAVWGMAVKLCPDRTRKTMAIVAGILAVLIPTTLGQVGVILAAGLFGMIFMRTQQKIKVDPMPARIGRGFGAVCLGLFITLLLLLPVLTAAWPNHALLAADAFYRTGSLVFGGGHVVLPLIQAQVVPSGWVSNEAFMAGYGAAQAVPGPLFTFSAFLGASMSAEPTGWAGGLLCLAAIYVPSFLLVFGVFPFWETLRRGALMQAAFTGINAAVVGLLLAALYQPVWTSAIDGPADFALALGAFAALMYWKAPAWLVVLGCGLVGGFIHSVS